MEKENPIKVIHTCPKCKKSITHNGNDPFARIEKICISCDVVMEMEILA